MVRLRNALSDEELSLGLNSAHDIFGKKDLAKRLTVLFKNIEGGAVCLLDGRWGTGKTTFVKQWMSDLKSEEISSVYFDAFSSDYVDSPFTALAGIFVKAAHEAERADDPQFRAFLDKAATVGKFIAATSLKVGLKAATLGALDAADVQEGVKDIASALAEGIGEISEAAVKKVLEEHADREAQFEALRLSLAGLPNLLSKRDDKSGPMIVFIDELDRCRPDFSLGIIEILKHFFRVDGIHFILVTSHDYLKLAVDHRYGSGVGGSEYLEKFYDFIVPFGHEYERHAAGSVAPFINSVMDRFIPQDSNESYSFKEMIRDFSLSYRLSLRQIENYCINSSLAFLSVQGINVYKPSHLISFVSLVKTIDRRLYDKIRNGNITWIEAEEFLDRGDLNGSYMGNYRSIIRWHTDEKIDANSEEWKNFGGRDGYGLSRLKSLPLIASGVVDRFAMTS